MSRLMIDSATEQEIVGLTDLPRPELAARWRHHYKADPPKGISRALLIRAVAYAIQVKATRGLKRTAKHRLFGDADASADTNAVAARRRTLQAGARLVREWNGKTHRVEVTEIGFTWNGVQYRSLSAIARAITSARWSGPRFFGLASGDAP